MELDELSSTKRPRPDDDDGDRDRDRSRRRLSLPDLKVHHPSLAAFLHHLRSREQTTVRPYQYTI
jgi:hypothetical protein